jgi:hypothetical protein
MNMKKVERIAGDQWRNSQLSVARLYGRITINGTTYIHDRSTDELVREDVYRKAIKDDRERRKEVARKLWEAQTSITDTE